METEKGAVAPADFWTFLQQETHILRGFQGPLETFAGHVDFRFNQQEAPGGFQHPADFFGIWGANPQRVFLVGNNNGTKPLLLQFDGKSWSEVQLATQASLASSIWGNRSSSDIYIGGQGRLARVY